MKSVKHLMFVCMLLPIAVANGQVTTDPTKDVVCKHPGDVRTVPNTLGLSPDDAKKVIEFCELVWLFADHPQVVSYENIGTIGRQEPRGGVAVKQGASVRGFASKGLYVPSFVGSPESTAVAFLKDVRLTVVIKTKRDSAPVGTVAEQEPQNAQFLQSDKPVTLTISEGLWVEVPKLVGIPYEDAITALKARKLVPQHAGGSLDNGTQPINKCETKVWYPVVASTVPDSGKVFEGDKINITTKTKVEVHFDSGNAPCP